MKGDRYTKVILTIIASCLLWICVRDIKIGGNFLFAMNGKPEPAIVEVAGGWLDSVTQIDTVSTVDTVSTIDNLAATALYLCEPITVTIDKPAFLAK